METEVETKTEKEVETEVETHRQIHTDTRTERHTDRHRHTHTHTEAETHRHTHRGRYTYVRRKHTNTPIRTHNLDTHLLVSLAVALEREEVAFLCCGRDNPGEA